jgi:hypothetical protein
LATIQTEITNAVETIADDVVRWSASKKGEEYTVKKAPIHLVLPQLTQKLGGDYVIVGTQTAVVVKRRAIGVKHGDVH